VSFVIDTTAPTVTVTRPTSAQRVGPGDVALAGTAGTGTGDSPTVHVVVRASATGPALVEKDATVAADGTWSTTASGLAEGAYTLTVSQSDVSGNTGTATSAFTVDLTAPTVSITSPVDGASALVGTVAVRGTGSRGTGDATTMTLEVHPGTDASAPATSLLNGTITSTGTWSVNVTGLAAGDWTFVARQSDTAGNVGRSAPVHLRLIPAMTVSGLSPSTILQGTTARTMVLSGANLPADTSVKVSGNGVTVTSATRDSASQMTLTVAAAAGANTGKRNVTLSSATQPSVTCSACLTVTAPPKVNSLAPAALAQGLTDQSVTVAGSGFTADTQLSIGGAGVTSTITARTASSLTLNVSVAVDAPTTARNVVVTNADGGTSTCVGCFTVAAPPTITSVTPATVRRGATVTATVTGTGFDKTMTLAVDGTGVTLSGAKYVSPTKFTVTVKVAATAALTAHTLTATIAASRGTGSLPNAITVVP
jgi:hypothetical protein